MLRPHICLDTKQMGIVRIWRIRINLFQRKESSHRHRLVNRRILRVIQIVVGIRRHDDIMSGLHRLHTLFRATPRHHHGIVGKTALHDFIPAYHLASMPGNDFLHIACNMALESG